LEYLNAKVEINYLYETVVDNIKMSTRKVLGYYELKERKPWFDEGCLELAEQGKQTELQWSRDRSEINGDILNNVRRETSRHFGNK
jgi:hypothetical protein